MFRTFEFLSLVLSCGGEGGEQRVETGQALFVCLQPSGLRDEGHPTSERGLKFGLL